MSAPLVSIVLITKNGAATLPALLDAIWRQRVPFPLEIIAVDSGSTDGSQDLLRPRVDEVIAIRPDEFDHGLTRNLGIDRARGALIVLLVQDALPVSDSWLAELTAPLVADATLAGTFARQQPRPDASAIVRYYLARWVASADVARTVALTQAELDAMSPLERLRTCAFDNVCSCVRRSVWKDHPFRSCSIAEDLEWARDVLLAGHRLMYVPQAVVVHSHERSARYEFTRTRALHRRLFDLFELQTIPSRAHLVRAIALSLLVHLRCELVHPLHMPRAVALAFAWPVGQYLGARASTRGGTPVRRGVV